MGNIVGKQFRVVASKDYATALAESVKEGNQAKFYLAQKGGKALDGVTATTDNDRNTLIINGNRIQGVSNNDISKLDTITTDVAKLLKYKGSVDTFNDLPTRPNASIGDVWRIKSNFTLVGVPYPAYTSVVCTTVAPVGWDALGGAMEMGTFVNPTITAGNSRLSYKTTEKGTPISAFEIALSTGLVADSAGAIRVSLSTGLVEDSTGAIKVDLGTGLSEKINNTLKFSGGSKPIGGFQIDVDTTHGIYITEDKKIGLLVATPTQGVVVDNSLLKIGNGLTPIASFNIKTGDGLRIDRESNEIVLKISTFGLHIDEDKQLCLSLSSSDNAVIPYYQYEYCQESGLCIDSIGGLRIAVATHYGSNGGDIIKDGIVIGSGYYDSQHNITYHGGLCISSKAIVQFVTKNTNIAGYINSLIEAKLQAKLQAQ